MVHVNGVDLVIVVGRVVVDALRCVAAGGVNRDLILVFSDLTAAALLVNGAENMEELAHAGALVIPGKGAELREGDLHETGLTRQIARDTQAAHAAAVGLKREYTGEAGIRLLPGNARVVVEGIWFGNGGLFVMTPTGLSYT